MQGGNTVREMRELFVCNSVLIQEASRTLNLGSWCQALVLEDDVKATADILSGCDLPCVGRSPPGCC